MSFAQIGGEITGAFGGAGPTYRGFRPQKGNIRAYERYQASDIGRLYGQRIDPVTGKRGGAIAGDVFAGPGLGYSPETLQLAKGLSEGERTAERQSLYDAYARSPYGVRSAEYLAAQEGVGRAQRESGERIGAGIALQGEQQKRADLYARLGGAGQAYGQGADLYNAYAQARYQSDMARFQERKNRYAAVGKAAGGVMDMWSGGIF